MSKRYKRLQNKAVGYDERPISIITKHELYERLFIIRGRDRRWQAWHYILVPSTNVANLKSIEKGVTIDTKQYGRIINYRNKRGDTVPTSGWGTDPPMRVSVRDAISLVYTHDDIRLCTMQRAVPDQLLGIYRCYNKRERFHYMELMEDLSETLARRAGLQDYDRVIEFNGVNIENDTYKEYCERFRDERHLPTQMLVCSPATYQYYKTNNKIIHSGLPTVQYLKPVYATSKSDSNTDTPKILFDEKCFCVVQWENSNTINTVSQSSVFKAPEFIHVGDICFIEINEQNRKAKILFIGAHDDCEKFQPNLDQPHDNLSSKETENILKTNNVVTSTKFEQLPNELLYYLFTYLETPDLYKAFWDLNTRLNILLQSLEHLSLNFDENTDQTRMKFYALNVDRLIIDTETVQCDYSLFSNLKILAVGTRNLTPWNQINPDAFVTLTHLSFLLGSEFISPLEIVTNIFTNKFSLLRYVELGQIDISMTRSWSIAPALTFVSICSKNPHIIEEILIACPNLDHLQLQVLERYRNNDPIVPLINYSLRQLTLWSNATALDVNDINAYLSYTSDLQHLYLQTMSRDPFIDLVRSLDDKLKYLS